MYFCYACRLFSPLFPPRTYRKFPQMAGGRGCYFPALFLDLLGSQLPPIVSLGFYFLLQNHKVLSPMAYGKDPFYHVYECAIAVCLMASFAYEVVVRCDRAAFSALFVSGVVFPICFSGAFDSLRVMCGCCQSDIFLFVWGS